MANLSSVAAITMHTQLLTNYCFKEVILNIIQKKKKIGKQVVNLYTFTMLQNHMFAKRVGKSINTSQV